MRRLKVITGDGLANWSRPVLPWFLAALAWLSSSFFLLAEEENEPSDPQVQIAELEQRIDQLKAERDLAGLEALAAVAKKEWLPSDDPAYYPLVLRLCQSLKSLGANRPTTYSTIRDLVVPIIDSPKQKSPRIAGELLLLLLGDPDCPRGKLNGDDWAKERNIRIQRWMKVWKSLHDELAALPAPKPYFLRVSPPPESGLPEGVGPEWVEDPVLRKKFQDAVDENNRKLAANEKRLAALHFEQLFAGVAKLELIGAYHKPPFNRVELEKTLADSGIEQSLRSEILGAVMKDESAESIAQKWRLDHKSQAAQTVEISPPGTAIYHSDPRFRKKVAFKLTAPKIQEILDELREQTGVALTRADDIQNDYPARGGIIFGGTPAWKVMDKVAAYERVEGRWEKDGDGYRLVRNGNPVAPPEVNEFAQVQPSPGW